MISVYIFRSTVRPVVMKVTALYCYPIKSLRGIRLESAQPTRTGFPYDRRFMLQKIQYDEDDSGKGSPRLVFKNMAIGTIGKMAFFQPQFHGDKGLRVTYKGPNSTEANDLDIPSEPSTAELQEHHVNLHEMPTKAYRMGAPYDEWFSTRFGYDVALIYIGPHHRSVPGNLNPGWSGPRGWSLSMLQQVPLVGPSLAPKAAEIDFADLAGYLVTTEESLENVSSRLPDGEKMDITKFRPNIVLQGSPEQWDEDFWAEIRISPSDGGSPVDIVLTANCGRCNSINVDYATGKNAVGPTGRILNTLRKDRCVDPGQKTSPVFGRYGFLTDNVLMRGCGVISIGDEAEVTRRAEERTVLRKE